VKSKKIIARVKITLREADVN